MKKIALIFLGMIFSVSVVFSQKTNDNGSTGGNNDNTKPADNTNNNDNNNSNVDDNCVSSILDLGGLLAGAYHKKLLGSKSKNPSVKSFEVQLIGGNASNDGVNFYNLLPRIKGNYGAFSGEIRLNHMIYSDDNSITTTSLDALAEFNLIFGAGFKMSLGQGVLYGLDSKEAFHESYAGAELGFMKRSLIFSPEFRYVYDWANEQTIQYEIDFSASYRVLSFQKLNLYLTAGGGYRNVSDIDYTLFFGGLNLVLQ